MELFESISGAMIVALAPVVTAIVEAIKKAGLPSRYAPLASIATGAALALAVGPLDTTTLLAGIATGAAASGLYTYATRRLTNA